MSEATQRALSSNRKKRGIVRGSVTRLRTRVSELEGSTDDTETADQARRLVTRLRTLAEEFKVHHYAVIDLLDDEGDLAKEQDIFDNFDDDVAQLVTHLERLAAKRSSTGPSACAVAIKHLRNLGRRLSSVSGDIGSLSPGEDNVCVLQQHEEHLSEMKRELASVRRDVISSDCEDTSEADDLLDTTERNILDCSLKVRKLLHTQRTASSVLDTKSIKLPRLDVPTFDGNILNWKTFWEQFDVSIHARSDLSDAEKLAYLRSALRNGTAKSVIEGLTRSGEQYKEAITCLKSHFDRPRLLHQTHVRKILEIPNLKDGAGRELRRLHDTAQQHLRALKALGHEPDGTFVTSMLELKLDTQTMFEWQRHSQESTDVPHFQDLLKFIDLRAQASESAVSDSTKRAPRNDAQTKKNFTSNKPVASFTASTESDAGICVVCKEKHPLYVCSKFKAMNHDEKRSALKSNDLCINCMRPGHFVKGCKSLHRCRVCQKPHHTLLHIERGEPPSASPASDSSNTSTPVSTLTAMRIRSNTLLMTCSVQVSAPDGSTMTARALLDSASSASFISDRLARALNLPRSHQITHISGVAGITKSTPLQSIATLSINTSRPPGERIDLTAIVVPKVACELPLQPIPFDVNWHHLSDLTLADPDFASPGRIDILLGVEIFVAVLLDGRRSGPPGSPVAFETKLGWVLAGNTHIPNTENTVVTYHTSVLTGDDLLRKFWEVEENPTDKPILSPEEKAAVKHFEAEHHRTDTGRFVVPLLRRPDAKRLGESRSQAVRRFVHFERSLHSKGIFPQFKEVIDEYFEKGHAEPVPEADQEKQPRNVFYLPMHAVTKESSTTTKIRAVFDASAKTSTGVSLNDTLLVGPTVHSSLVDVLLRFRFYRVALTADVSRMYRAIALMEDDKDLHRFVWRNSPEHTLKDYRMTRLTFGVSASSFVANMCVRQNALDFTSEYPLAAKTTKDSFYVDDTLTGADSIQEAIQLHQELQSLFERGGFLLRKWSSSEAAVLEHIDPNLRDQQPLRTFSETAEYTKTLGVEWNSTHDHFRLVITELPSQKELTKRSLTSDIAKVFDVFGWIAPVIVKAKILLQRLWEERVQWDDPVPEFLHQMWFQWRSELPLLMEKLIPRCYHPKDVRIAFKQLHGFSDASEQAYAGVVYLRMVDSTGQVHTSLVIAKTKVAPIKRLSIPRLELCGAQLLAQLLHHCQRVFNFPSQDVFAWTDSTVKLDHWKSTPIQDIRWQQSQLYC